MIFGLFFEGPILASSLLHELPAHFGHRWGSQQMRALNQLSTMLALGLVTLLVRIGPAGATVFEVRIDTSGVSGDAVMTFDFNNSDAGSDHQLVIRDFVSDGSLYVSATVDPANCPSPVFPFSADACKDPANSSVAGTLGQSPAVTISDAGSSDPTISYYQRIALPGGSSSSISFRFEMSGDPTTGGASPDGFAFWLLDSDFGAPLLGPGPLVLYTFGETCDTASSEGVATCTEVRVPSVPEPGPATLSVAALLALACTRWPASAFRRRSAVRV